MVKKITFVVVATLVMSSGLLAQVSGRISGKVEDATGAAVPNAKLTLTLPASSAVVSESETTDAGLFSISGLRADFYDLTVEKAGFKKTTERNVKVDGGAETVLSDIRLEVGTVTEVVDVTESLNAVQLANAEVSSTLRNEQVRALPQLNRYVSSLFLTQVGVGNGRGAWTINGQRSTFTNVTLDGINIQDNLFRESGVSFQPSLPTVDQIQEFTVFTSNSNASIGGGASQIAMTTRSGTNEYHGSVLWYNRNNATAANDWFSNQSGIKAPFLNQNQFGGSLGGPILKNKLLFYANYEGFRRRQQDSLDRTILTADARQGIFTYRDSSGVVRKANVLTLAGVGIDPAMAGILAQIPGPENINQFRNGDSTAALLRNSAGYSFNAAANRDQDKVIGKLDYYLSPKHGFSTTYNRTRDKTGRNSVGIANDFSKVPKVSNDSTLDFLSASHRWSPTASLSNELRGGFNIAPAPFVTTQEFGPYIIDAAFLRSNALASNPTNTFRNQGRDTSTYALNDTASWVHGRHSVQFGFSFQKVNTAPYNDVGITPRYDLAIGTGNTGLAQAQLPGISTADFTAANNLLAFLAGYVDGYTQTFNVNSRNSGFVPGATDLKHYYLNNTAVFVQDQWKILPRLSVSLGLRYEMFGVVDERDGLALMPVVQNNNVLASLTSANGTLDFAGKAAGRPFYNRDKNDFAPNIGFAWDPFGSGRTAIRGGYSIGYANDNHIAAIRNSVVTNAGLVSTVAATGLTGRITASRPAIPTPAYKVPRTYADNFALSTTSAAAMPDPNLRTPYVQQWNFGIQQELKGNVIEVRYVGNHGTKLLRGLDYNQVIIKENGFLDDFNRAYSNGFLARTATGSFNPNYNPAIPGSQPLTIFPRLGSAGLLTNATILGLIQRGEVGELASTYQANRLNGPINFYGNPNAQGNNLITNNANSTFNALQVDVVRRMKGGLQIQGNYQFGKVLSDSLGDGQARFEALLDAGNGKIEKARAPFDLKHTFKMNGKWELPFGTGHRLNKQGMNWLVGGWAMSGSMTWQSGTPFSILSTRGTLNRQARSLTTNTATAVGNLDNVVGYQMTGNGPVFINPAAIGPDGRGTASDGLPRFAGQAFINPTPGTLGALQRRMFSGPSDFNLDASIQKVVKIGERQSIEIRADAFNLPNHPAFYVGDDTASAFARSFFDINQPTFGLISQTLYDRRILQFGAYYRF